jgi:hypothetical protein
MKRAVEDVVSEGCKKVRTRRGFGSIASWNVNGFRACLKKEDGFMKFVRSHNPDIICLNEVKCSSDAANTMEMKSLGYEYIYWNSAEIKKGGYSGTAFVFVLLLLLNIFRVFSKINLLKLIMV